MEPALNVVLKFGFKDLWKLVKQLPDKQQVKMLEKLKKELEKKGLVTWTGSSDHEPDLLEALDEEWEEEFSDEEEIQMTDEEFYKTVQEMS